MWCCHELFYFTFYVVVGMSSVHVDCAMWMFYIVMPCVVEVVMWYVGSTDIYIYIYYIYIYIHFVLCTAI